MTELQQRELSQIFAVWEAPESQAVSVLKLIETFIQSAILAEREVCAKIAADFANDCRNEAKLKPVNPDYREFFSEIMAISGSSIASQIRARSNAPETPNKPLESSKNLQSSTFPASAMKTCS